MDTDLIWRRKYSSAISSCRSRKLAGLLGANQKIKGEIILTLFRLTGFETAPDDFREVLAQTCQKYPPPNKGIK